MTSSSQPSETNTATLFLRLEGPFQSWGGRTIGRFRRTEAAPTKSGVMGLLGAALGLSRQQLNHRLDELNHLAMAVRVDRAGEPQGERGENRFLEDYQTVGAKIGVLKAEGGIKRTGGGKTDPPEPIISPREYLIDASFLIFLLGDRALIEELAVKVQKPKWPLFLGRKRCVPGTRVFAGVQNGLTLVEAVRRDGPEDDSLLKPDRSESVRIITDMIDVEAFGSLLGIAGIDIEGNDASSRYEAAKAYVTDRLVRLDPPVHGGRIVLDFEMPRPTSTLNRPDLADPPFSEPGPIMKPRAKGERTPKQLAREKSGGPRGRCIFCRHAPDNPKQLHAHHLTYVRVGRERVDIFSDEIGNDDLLMLCDECHAAVTMLEYQNGFGLQRIDPREPRWHSRIVAAREARQRQADPGRPIVGAGPKPRIDADGRPIELIESVIPLKAGSSYAADAPGNRWLANPHHVHQRLSMAFPDAGGQLAAKGYGVTRKEGGFLFRIERGPTARLVVRSRILPDWGRAFATAGWLVEQKLPTPRLFDLAAFPSGVELTFDVEVNPVKRLRADGPEGRKGARVPLRDNDALICWIGHRASDGGFEILNDTLTVEPLGRHTALMRSVPNRHWDSVRFTGQLRVIDSVAFAEALTNGIGPAKAFGFGLLSITRG